MPAGRPTEYNEGVLEMARTYLESCQDTNRSVEEKLEPQPQGGSLKRANEKRLKVSLPTKGGLARYLGVARETLYDWSSKYGEFSDIMEQLGAEQEDRLINNGLSGDYNPTIAKVLLTKHGYRDAVDADLTTKGDKINNDTTITELTTRLNALYRGTGIPGDGESSVTLGTEASDQE